MNQATEYRSTHPPKSIAGSEQSDNTVENISAMSDLQFRESLDTLLESFEDQQSDFFLDETGSLASSLLVNSQQSSLIRSSDPQLQQNINTGSKNVGTGDNELVSLAAAYEQYVQNTHPSVQFVGARTTGLSDSAVAQAPTNTFSMPVTQMASNPVSFGNSMPPAAGTPFLFTFASAQSYPFTASYGQTQQVSPFAYLSNQQSQAISMQPSQMLQSSATATTESSDQNRQYEASHGAKRTSLDDGGSCEIRNKSKRQRKCQTVCQTMPEHQDIAVTEDEGDQEKRRHERNMREQLRSHQITSQINDLRELLKASRVPFKMDKFSTLVTVDQYIRDLQERSAALDAEQKKLLTTLAMTTEIVNNQYMPRPAVCNDPVLFGPKDEMQSACHSTSSDKSPQALISKDQEDESISFVKGIDFKCIFDFCPVACSITSLDGRFLDCNEEFLSVTGFTRGELILKDNRHHGSAFAGSSEYRKSTINVSVPIVTYSSGIINVNENDAKSCTSRPQSPGTVPEFSHERNKSLFNVLHRDNIEQLFCAMSEMLKFRDDGNEKPVDTWVETVMLCRKEGEKVSIRVNLVKACSGLPRYFHCFLLPAS